MPHAHVEATELLDDWMRTSVHAQDELQWPMDSLISLEPTREETSLVDLIRTKVQD